MSTRRTLPTRADGRASNKFASTKPKAPAKAVTMLDMSDLANLDEDALKRIAACDALRALIGQVRKPTRHATAVTSAARSLLDFSSAKPAQATTISAPGGGPVQSRHEIVFCKPGEVPEDLK